MDASPEHRGASLQLQANMSLLDSPDADSPVHDGTSACRQPDSETQGPTNDVAVVSSHDDLLQDVSQWIRELETARDEMYMLSAQNAFLLDSMAMAGAHID